MASTAPIRRHPFSFAERFAEPPVPGSRRTRLIVAAVLLVVGLLMFTRIWDWWTHKEDLSRWDIPLLAWLLQHRIPPLTVTLEVITTITAPTGMIIISLVTVVVWLARSRHWWRPVLLAGAMAVAVACIVGIKSIAGRGRPPVADMLMGADASYSFPSGHTLGTATFTFVLVYLLFFRPGTTARRGAARWVAAAGALVAVFVVAFSRLYLGYHWLTDVTASALLAVAILGVVIAVDTWRPTARHSVEPGVGTGPNRSAGRPSAPAGPGA
ncbi:phosphatase PAP2 family protein [Tersicoccus sp. MR15.9]|uniref:phosphatase PAP2 family protein n=1 Tax=Tersicoccus mangrovi TaxID=3121635 RepID=UPI002FE62991